jgi:hypothetical protein
MKDDFRFTLEHVSDNPDGSGNFKADFSDDVAQILIQRGIQAILEDYIKQEANRPKSKQEKRLKQLLSEDRK